MRVKRNATTQTVTVELKLGATVQISDAELWMLLEANDTQIPGHVTASVATWTGVPAPAGKFVDFTVYWTAFEPNNPKWIYDAVITVTDQTGAKLNGAGGYQNPTNVPSEVGKHQAHYGRGMHPILIEP